MGVASEPPLAISSLIEEIRQKLQDFRRTQVSHVLRQGNRDTHLLAQFARHVVGYVTCIEETTYMVKLVLTNDVMMLSSS